MMRKILLGAISFAVFAGVLLFSYGQLTAAPSKEAPEIMTKDYVLITAESGDDGPNVGMIVGPPSEEIKEQYR